MIVPSIMFVRTNEAARPTHQPRGVRLRRTSELILSVTESKVCPGSMTAGVTCILVSSYGSYLSISVLTYAFSPLVAGVSLPLARWQGVVRVANRRQIGRARARVE